MTALERAGQPVVRIAVDGREALGREIFRWEMATAIACASDGRQPVRRAQRHRGEGRDQRAARPARGRGQAAGPARGHLRGRRRRADPRAPRDGDAERLPRVLRLFPAHAGARRGAHPHARRLPRPHAQRDHGRLRAALPALDRTAAQGRPEHGRVPAADGGHAPPICRSPARATASRPCATRRRWATYRCSSAGAGARCASTWAPTSTPAWTALADALAGEAQGRARKSA